MSQDTDSLSHISIDTYNLEAVHKFVCLGCIIADNLFMDAELSRHIGKASTTLAWLPNRVWSNNKLTVHTEMQV